MKHRDDGFFLPENASKARVREAENARKNRGEIVKAFSQGQVTRRDLVKMGLITTGGLLMPIHGLNPFVSSAYASIPTGAPPSPLFGALPFTQPCRVSICCLAAQVGRQGGLNPAADRCRPTRHSRRSTRFWVEAFGPIEGRPPGAIWAHQQFTQFPPQMAIEATQAPAQTNTVYNPGVPSSLNSGIDPTTADSAEVPPEHADAGSAVGVDFQRNDSTQTGHGQYGEPILFRHHNGLPVDVTQNGGFGRNTISHPRAQRPSRSGE